MRHRVDRLGVGPVGEDIAVGFLERRGFEIVDRNVRIGRDELDIIARRADRNIVVEVKCTTDGTDPLDVIDDEKLGRLERAARAYPRQISRIDAIAVRLSNGGADVRWVRSIR